MINIFKTLVEFPTISGDQAVCSEALDYIDSFLAERGMHVTRFEWNGYESLVATVKPTFTPAVMLGAHLDVVPAVDEMFQLKHQAGKFYGRGVYDMKFAIAVYLQLIDDLKDSLHNYDFGIMITTDEEMGGRNGVKKLLDHGYRPEVCVLPDGGENWQIETNAKGIWWTTVKTTGKNAHASRPWEGESATLNLAKLLTKFGEHFPQLPESNTFNAGIVTGGTAQNQIAEIAMAKIDVRFTSQHSQAHLQQELEKLCKKYGGVVTENSVDAPCNNSLENPYIHAFARCIQNVTGVEVIGSKSMGASDARHFAEVGIPCVVAMPPGGGWHSDNEWISEKGMYHLRDILHEYLLTVANSPKSAEPSEELEALAI